MRQRDRIVRAWQRQLDPAQEPSRALIVLAIAVLTFLAAGLAGLQVDAGVRSATAGRTADAAAAAATERGVGGLIRTQMDMGVYRRHVELVFDAAWARRMAAPAEPAAPGDRSPDALDPELAAELADIDTELAAWARNQSPLLLPPYWDEATAQTDIGALDAERNVGPQVRAGLERRIAGGISEAWGRRSADYVTAVTLVAVALFFLGLAAALVGPARRILVASGLAFGLLALGAGAAITLRPIPSVPDSVVEGITAAEQALVRAAWDGSAGQLSERSRRHYENAAAAADRAVEAASDFAPARLVRADVRLRYATDLLLSRRPDEAAAMPIVELALEDFRAATALDDDAYGAWWNYGWAAYLAGRHELSIDATNRAIELAPDQFTLLFNRALARISAGDTAGAHEDVTQALAVAARARFDSNGWFFSRTDAELRWLAALRPAEREALLVVQRRLREAAVAATLGRAVGSAGRIDHLELRTLTVDDQGRLTAGDAIAPGDSASPAGVSGFRLVVGGDVPEGAIVSVRVYEDGLEQPGYRVDRGWPSGGSTMTIDLVSPFGRMGADVDAAEHELEVYVDGRTSAATAFAMEHTEVFHATAASFLDLLPDAGFECGPAETNGSTDRSTTRCVTAGATPEDGSTIAVLADGTGRMRRLTVSANTLGGMATGLARELVGAVLSLALNPAIETEALEWVESAEPGASTTIAGATFGITDDGSRLSVTIEVP